MRQRQPLPSQVTRRSFSPPQFFGQKWQRQPSSLTVNTAMGVLITIWMLQKLGSKDNNPPCFDALFFMNHTKGGSLIDSESSSKHAQLEEPMSSYPSLYNAQLMEAKAAGIPCLPAGDQVFLHSIFWTGASATAIFPPWQDRHETAMLVASAQQQNEAELQAMQEENRELREENRVTNSRASCMEKEWEELKNKLSSN